MSLFILDTDILTLFQRNHPTVIAHVHSHGPRELAITVLSVEEQLSGWYTAARKAKQPEELARAYRELAKSVRFPSCLQIVEYEVQAMHLYEEFRKQKIKISRMDLRIAATVLQQPDATLVTRNTRDFKQVPGLRIEDWSK